jgi:transcriptional regulator with XRE-family HTH domain
MVGKRIAEYLDSHGIKRTFVAEKAGVERARFSNMLNKDQTIDCTTYYRICKVLDVPYETFIEGGE